MFHGPCCLRHMQCPPQSPSRSQARQSTVGSSPMDPQSFLYSPEEKKKRKEQNYGQKSRSPMSLQDPQIVTDRSPSVYARLPASSTRWNPPNPPFLTSPHTCHEVLRMTNYGETRNSLTSKSSTPVNQVGIPQYSTDFYH